VGFVLRGNYEKRNHKTAHRPKTPNRKDKHGEKRERGPGKNKRGINLRRWTSSPSETRIVDAQKRESGEKKENTRRRGKRKLNYDEKKKKKTKEKRSGRGRGRSG